jgi:hypothetical protein
LGRRGRDGAGGGGVGGGGGGGGGRQVGANSVPLSPLPQWLQLLPPNHPQYPLGKQLQPCPPALVAVMPRSVESLQRQLRLL